ncbi:hypothetical protein [Sphingomonas sp. CCH9-F2]|uniref:hypothetical protein n=1 Tax=Sphingomonas sp. CCH9-F2 TaxID=1768778 RepID=UPI000836A530|nr:hypothetical protein [Sphingomonas sp. CCH9-F2]
MAALAVLAGPASAGPVGDGQLAALSTRLFPLLDAAGRDPVALERLATAPGMQAILRTRRARRVRRMACIPGAVASRSSATGSRPAASSSGNSRVDSAASWPSPTGPAEAGPASTAKAAMAAQSNARITSCG